MLIKSSSNKSDDRMRSSLAPGAGMARLFVSPESAASEVMVATRPVNSVIKIFLDVPCIVIMRRICISYNFHNRIPASPQQPIPCAPTRQWGEPPGQRFVNVGPR